MTQILIPAVTSAGNSYSASNKNYANISTGSTSPAGTESFAAIIWRTAGTFSNMYIRIDTNGTTSSSPFTFRVGTANGNETISIGAGVTGELTDGTHTDTIASGNSIDTLINNGGGGSIIVMSTTFLFAPTTTTNTLNRMSCGGSIADTSATTTYYQTIAGLLSIGANSTTEANAQYENQLTATLQNLFVDVSANTASVATVTSRVGGSPGNLTVTIGSGSTGTFEDTTHSDSISATNLINTALNSTVTTSLTIRNIAVDLLTTTGKTHFLGGNSGGGTAQTAGGTRSMGVGGAVGFGLLSEVNLEIEANAAFTASSLQGYAVANTVTATSNMHFRIGGVNGNNTFAIAASTTGYFADATHTDSITSANEIDYQLVTGGTGTSITFTNVGILAHYNTTSTFQPAWAMRSSLAFSGSPN